MVTVQPQRSSVSTAETVPAETALTGVLAEAARSAPGVQHPVAEGFGFHHFFTAVCIYHIAGNRHGKGCALGGRFWLSRCRRRALFRFRNLLRRQCNRRVGGKIQVCFLIGDFRSRNLGGFTSSFRMGGGNAEPGCRAYGKKPACKRDIKSLAVFGMTFRAVYLYFFHSVLFLLLWIFLVLQSSRFLISTILPERRAERIVPRVML